MTLLCLLNYVAVENEMTLFCFVLLIKDHFSFVEFIQHCVIFNHQRVAFFHMSTRAFFELNTSCFEEERVLFIIHKELYR